MREQLNDPAKVFCTTCGTANPAGQKYCGNCGTPLRLAISDTPAAAVPARPKRRGWLRGCLIGSGALFGIVVLLGIVASLGSGGSDAPGPTAAIADLSAAPAVSAAARASSAARPTAAPRPTARPKPTATPRPTATATPIPETFTRANWDRLDGNPAEHKGARVEIVGKVFQTPDRTAKGVGWQMWADPKNSEWNTIVLFADAGFALKDGDFVRVVGAVAGAYEGTNAFGATLSVPQIIADRAEVVDALAAASPAVRSAALDATQTQHGLTLVVERVEFAADETRVLLRLANASADKASFYDFNAKATQGDKQFEAETFTDYPEVQSELLPGVKSSGVLVYPAMDPAQPTRLFLEARTDDYSVDFTPFVFDIQP